MLFMKISQILAIAILPVFGMTTSVYAASECGGPHPGKCWDVEKCPSATVLAERGTTCTAISPKGRDLIMTPKEFSKSLSVEGLNTLKKNAKPAASGSKLKIQTIQSK
jgi:hypothetical protein